ncbi:MAG: hypothetical protein BWK76_07905 [Desulfobulbaceae bacterium A2]|nr:MAG: hypothetical protein BWK76_07905 [Desulfobulbaceae bacterium A2]
MPTATATPRGVIRLLACSLAVALSTPLVVAAMDDAPDEVRIESLGDLYRAVTFDHKLHAEMAENCALCHHHTTGTVPPQKTCQRCHQGGKHSWTVSCSACHPAQPFSSLHLAEVRNDPLLFHTNTQGLKGAYHQLCLGCHREVGAPVGCQDCHVRSEKGDAFFHAAAAMVPKDKKSGH